ncbi:myelin protein zero-like protein 2b isoform X1 [Clupea harengus]|uniref:Myelin protein zero-like protein 2b isoform X1 n=1 Tax=Clupea harengus TaxID=7950 RepID=A0A6P8FN21_CLUHA|nr:myelin protein zero-like protein 2b isoform X1 [Clupea harengus]
MIRTWICLFAVLAGFATPGIVQVRAIEVYMNRKEVEAVNGTSVKLQCTFKSSEPIFEDSVIVGWNFRPLKPGAEETVFHYQEGPFPPTEGRFKGHAVWSGDIMKEDASITLLDVQFNFNGTFSCEVRNPPDFQGIAGEVILKVVEKASISDIKILAASVGGAIAVVIVILIIFVLVRRRLSLRDDDEEPEVELRESLRKDPTVW